MKSLAQQCELLRVEINKTISELPLAYRTEENTDPVVGRLVEQFIDCRMDQEGCMEATTDMLLDKITFREDELTSWDEPGDTEPAAMPWEKV